jgi:hypothetical protein
MHGYLLAQSISAPREAGVGYGRSIIVHTQALAMQLRIIRLKPCAQFCTFRVQAQTCATRGDIVLAVLFACGTDVIDASLQSEPLLARHPQPLSQRGLDGKLY